MLANTATIAASAGKIANAFQDGFSHSQPAASAAPTPGRSNVTVNPNLAALPRPAASCLNRYAAVGLPGTGAPGEVLLCHQNYAVGYNAADHNPDWVIERLQPSELVGPANRSDQFGHDPSLPNGMDATNEDYDRSGYDRGHQAPAGDSKFSQKVMDESFYFTNMAPQIGIGFNRGAWKYLEESVRAWVSCGGHPDLYVITGPIYLGSGRPPIGQDKVVVPAKFYKIVYDAASQRAVGFVLPNVRIGSTIDNLQAYVVPIAEIEGDTGLTFFPALDPRQQAQLKRQPGIAWGHVGSCAVAGGE